MRAIAVFLLLGIAAGPAAAQDAAGGARKKAPAAKKASPVRASPVAVPSMAAAAQSAAAGAAASDVTRGRVEARRLDLTPQTQFASGKIGTRTDLRGREQGPELTLGSDGDWRAQAAQVGVMAAAFSALVAVCGNGRCMLPDLFGGGGKDDIGPPSGLEIRSQPGLRDPR